MIYRWSLLFSLPVFSSRSNCVNFIDKDYCTFLYFPSFLENLSDSFWTNSYENLLEFWCWSTKKLETSLISHNSSQHSLSSSRRAMKKNSSSNSEAKIGKLLRCLYIFDYFFQVLLNMFTSIITWEILISIWWNLLFIYSFSILIWKSTIE